MFYEEIFFSSKNLHLSLVSKNTTPKIRIKHMLSVTDRNDLIRIIGIHAGGLEPVYDHTSQES
jgi:hypothetical protein